LRKSRQLGGRKSPREHIGTTDEKKPSEKKDHHCGEFSSKRKQGSAKVGVRLKSVEIGKRGERDATTEWQKREQRGIGLGLPFRKRGVRGRC